MTRAGYHIEQARWDEVDLGVHIGTTLWDTNNEAREKETRPTRFGMIRS